MTVAYPFIAGVNFQPKGPIFHIFFEKSALPTKATRFMGRPLVAKDRGKVKPIPFISKVDLELTPIFTVRVIAISPASTSVLPPLCPLEPPTSSLLILCTLVELKPIESRPSNPSISNNVSEKVEANPPSLRFLLSRPEDPSELDRLTTTIITCTLNHPKLNEFLISNPHLTIETNSPSDQNHPRILKVQESNQLVRVAWRFNRHCQTLHQNPENLVKLLCVAWGSGGYRQAVPLQEPRNRLKCMCRLVGMNAHQAVSGNFPETQKWNKKRETFIQFRICHAIQTQT
ncbi:hypothetical protein DEO72_LG4g877 [Vigna unguiculata]|uniref:Uncharacterized protein n=1 Tax=Vigna unguiculata TaxID=3917 RepID=A0A4D6LNI6_VIGUN|nr:hypothetical protein DEO72_LG4g877 [Vigna unguiculata]